MRIQAMGEVERRQHGRTRRWQIRCEVEPVQMDHVDGPPLQGRGDRPPVMVVGGLADGVVQPLPARRGDQRPPADRALAGDDERAVAGADHRRLDGRQHLLGPADGVRPHRREGEGDAEDGQTVPHSSPSSRLASRASSRQRSPVTGKLQNSYCSIPAWGGRVKS